jgi:hypothetical protein
LADGGRDHFDAVVHVVQRKVCVKQALVARLRFSGQSTRETPTAHRGHDRRSDVGAHVHEDRD